MKILYFFLFPVLLIAQQLPFPQDTVAYNNLFNNRQYAAFDQDGKIHVTYSASEGTASTTCEIYYAKENADGSFTTIPITNNSFNDNYPTLSFDQNQKMHVGYIGRDAVNFQIKYINNVSGSFLNPIDITTGGPNKATPFSKIGPDSIMHFVYFTFETGSNNAYYRSFRLRDSVLSPELFLVAAEVSGDFQAALEIDAAGKVHILVKAGSLWGGPLKYYSNVSGTMTEIPTGIAVNVGYPRIKFDNQQNPVIVYRNETDDRLYVTKKSGATFTTPYAITPGGQMPSGIQDFAIDDSNYVYVVYQSSQSASGKGFYLVYGKDNTFSDTINISAPTLGYVTRNSSHIIAKGKGDVAIFYSPGGVRNTYTICDIFMKKGNVFGPVPVELSSFTASSSGNNVTLYWSTATEKNNYGFEIERKAGNEDWNRIAFIDGKGTTVNENYYTFSDVVTARAKYFYRLKQVDFDGRFEYSNTIEVETGVPGSFGLAQNYPNPFNPATVISYALPYTAHVELNLYDVLGNKVAMLLKENKPAGTYDFHLDTRKYNLPSGVYIYRMQAGEFTNSKKLVLTK